MKQAKRIMKVYYSYHGPPYVKCPMIRLAGNYLSAMNYNIGDEIEISVGNEKIVITKRIGSHVIPRQGEPMIGGA